MRLIRPRRSFNPRTREGCDSSWGTSATMESCFNPRTREGCDPSGQSPLLFFEVSIHAPVKGATQSKGDRPVYDLTFQSTHP